jgi:hypothetical protein
MGFSDKIFEEELLTGEQVKPTDNNRVMGYTESLEVNKTEWLEANVVPMSYFKAFRRS